MIKRIFFEGTCTNYEDGSVGPAFADIESDHPYYQYVDRNLMDYDHKEFATVFRLSLNSEVREKLFDPLKAGTPYILEDKDFKPCEDRRLLRFSSRLNQNTQQQETSQVKTVEHRWQLASEFGEAICQTFEDYRKVRPISEEISSLKRKLGVLENRTPTEDNELNHDIEIEEASGRLELLKVVQAEKGSSVTHQRNYAARSCAYAVQHQTFIFFGDAPPDAQGKYSGRGLPFLTAKIVNCLFGLSEADRLDASKVHDIYARGSKRVGKFNTAMRKR